jgi:hypothetical protein
MSRSGQAGIVSICTVAYSIDQRQYGHVLTFASSGSRKLHVMA